MRVGEETEDGVNGETQHHDVGPIGRLGLHDEIPETALGVDLFGDDDDQPAADERESQADEKVGQRTRQDDLSHESPAIEAEGLARLDQFGVDAAYAREGVDVDGEGRTRAR